MAYAFENVAHGAQKTKYAPALKYVQDSVVAPESLPAAPESTTTPPAGSPTPPAATTTTVTTTTIEEAAKAHLVGGVKLSGGKLLATVACGGSSGTCHVILEIGLGNAIDTEVPVSVAAGQKKTVKVKPTKTLEKTMSARPKAKLTVRLVAPEGKARKVKAG